MILTSLQAFIIVCMVTLGTMITRFLAFIIFKNTKANHPYIDYLGKVLPYAAIGLLVVYCLKGVSFKGPTYGMPEAIAIACVVILHYWKENTLISIGAGTVIYMVLVQCVFV